MKAAKAIGGAKRGFWAERVEVVHITRHSTSVAVLVSEPNMNDLGVHAERDCWQAARPPSTGRTFPTKKWMAAATAHLAAASLDSNEISDRSAYDMRRPRHSHATAAT